VVVAEGEKLLCDFLARRLENRSEKMQVEIQQAEDMTDV
jgi:hypothetical protein